MKLMTDYREVLRGAIPRQSNPSLQHGQLPSSAKQAICWTLRRRIRLPGWVLARWQVDKQRRRRGQRRILGVEDRPDKVTAPRPLEGRHRTRVAAA